MKKSETFTVQSVTLMQLIRMMILMQVIYLNKKILQNKKIKNYKIIMKTTMKIRKQQTKNSKFFYKTEQNTDVDE